MDTEADAEACRKSAEEQLADGLRELRIEAGLPSLRDIAGRVDRGEGRGVSHTTVAAMFRDRYHQRVWPSWGIIADVVVALGGNPVDFHAPWRQMIEQQSPVSRPGPGPDPALDRIAAAAERIADALERAFPAAG